MQKMATEGQKIAIRQIANRLVSTGSVSFSLLDNLDTLTAEEAGIFITNHKPKGGFYNSYMNKKAPTSLTEQQKSTLALLISEKALTAKEQSELFLKAGARFLETLTVSQATFCITHLTQNSLKQPFTGHA